jgi:hypothetical protein
VTRARDSRDRIVADATAAEGTTGGIVTADAEDSIAAVAAATGTDMGIIVDITGATHRSDVRN